MVLGVSGAVRQSRWAYGFRAEAAVALAGVRVDTQILWAVMSAAVPLPEIPEFPGALEVLRKKYPLDESLRHAL